MPQWGRIRVFNTSTPATPFVLEPVADNSIAVVGGKSPQQGSVEVAIVQTAVYDAVNAICGYPFTAYAVKPKVHVPALTEAAVAAAAHDVLIALYPDQAAALDQQYADYLEHYYGDPQSKSQRHRRRPGDGGRHPRIESQRWTERWARLDSTSPSGPAIGSPLPPGFLPPATPWIRAVTPWTMTSPSQFRVPPPPSARQRRMVA